MSLNPKSPSQNGRSETPELRLTNTSTHTKEIFTPLVPGCVKMYVCGPTVYDRAHIGNARCYVVFDVLFRVLRSLYPKVIYVRNITDIDDKIIHRAQKRECSMAHLTEETTRHFHEDMAALGNLPPTFEPKATDHIPQIISMIEGLIATNHAYVEENHVFFSVESDIQYGALSHHDTDLLMAGARVEIGLTKKHPHDFVLWKPSLSDEIGWESPWGRGRPGWHIECSAMSAHLMGPSFDIHGGGQDLIFPHHENERAQSTCFHKAPFVSYWVHNGYLLVNGEKMSKSLGNFLTPHDLLKTHSGEAIRYALLSSHYKQPLNWTSASLHAAQKSLDRLYRALQSGLSSAPGVENTTSALPQDILADLLDDLNTPKALASLHGLAKKILQEEDIAKKQVLAQFLYTGGAFLGLLQSSPQEWFEKPILPTLSVDQITSFIEERKQARASKDFSKADEIRLHLLQNRIILEDTPQGTTWHTLSPNEPIPA